MTDANYQLFNWLVASLFWMSVLVSFCGLVFIISPGVLTRYSKKLNQWISTTDFFNLLDKPRHIERRIYHYHRIFGLLISFGAAYSLFVFLFDMDIQKISDTLPVLINPSTSEWLYEMIYYLLVCADGLALLAGVIVLIRPSLLKGLETLANKWVTSDKYTKSLDRTHSIPEHILPGNVRIFGLIVFIGGVYIMVNTGAFLLK